VTQTGVTSAGRFAGELCHTLPSLVTVTPPRLSTASDRRSAGLLEPDAGSNSG
jgi:hypothetical protein